MLYWTGKPSTGIGGTFPMTAILESISPAIIIGVIVLLSIILFRRSIKLIFRLLLNTIGGFIFLVVLDLVAPFGVSLGISLLNIAVIAILGLPGVGLLLLLQWLLLI